jgi:ornithine cyclodeaminase
LGYGFRSIRALAGRTDEEEPLELRIINAAAVRRLLPMGECIDVMAAAMAALSAGTVAIPPRLLAPLADDSDALLLMPGSSTQLPYYGAKVVSLHPGNPARGLPALQGFVALFDRDSGSPVALLEGGEITAIRTAAASGLATRLLAREDATSCGIFGTGVQAISHIDAMLAVRPLEEILIWGRDAGRATALAEAQSQRTGKVIRATADAAEAAACAILCTVTGSPGPILKGAWVKPGTHVNLVGSHTLSTREADTELIARAALYVDSMESSSNEGGDFMIPLREGAIAEDAILGEIGQVVSGELPGRTGADQITVYNSLGITAQDLYAARHILDKAEAAGVGEVVAF